MALRLDPSRWLLGPMLGLFAAVLGVVAGAEPRIAIVISLGIAFVVIAFANLPAGVAIFGFLGFIEVLPSGGPVLSVTKATGLLLALSWLAMVTTDSGSIRNFITAHSFPTMLIVAFLGWVALSATWAADPGAALGSFGRYFLDAFLFMIIFSAVRKRADAHLLVAAFLAGAVTAAAYGLVHQGVGDDRLGTALLDPNELASVLVSGAALSIAVFAVNAKRPLVRILATAGGLFCLAAILLTLSRGGLIALGVALVAAVLVSGKWRPVVALMVAALACGVVIYFANFASPEVRDRVTHTTSGQDRIAEGRTSLWQVALRAFDAHPVEGIGSGNFRGSARNYLSQPGLIQRGDEILRDQPVHNAYLETLSELGIVGLALFMGVIGFSISSMLRAIRAFGAQGDTAMEAFTMAVVVALVGNLAAQFFISAQYSKQLWLLLGLGPALLAVALARLPDRAA